MDPFLSRKRPRSPTPAREFNLWPQNPSIHAEEDTSTEIKLATLASLYPDVDQSTLLDLLIASDGSVAAVSENLNPSIKDASPRKRSPGRIGQQTVFTSFATKNNLTLSKARALTRKGQTLHLYAADDIAAHTPCSIIKNFLPREAADSLLKELLEEAPTFERQTFKLFDHVVQSPHSACFYVDSLEEQMAQTTEYVYNGSYLTVWLSPLLLFVDECCLLILDFIGCSPDNAPDASCIIESQDGCQSGDLKTHPAPLP